MYSKLQNIMARSGELWTRGCPWMMTYLVIVTAAFIGSLTAQTTTTTTSTTTTTTIATTDAQEAQLDDGSFWYGTQTMLCLAGVGAGPVRPDRLLSRPRRSFDASVPWRPDFVYIHRLLRYRDRVFEWGSGARGYHVGPSESVTDCPVTWESAPAGRSDCPAERLARWTAAYRRQYGGYNLLTNNCHHFANRAVALLRACSSLERTVQTSTTSTTTTMEDLVEVQEVEDDPAGPSRPMKAAWDVLSWIISYVTDRQKQDDN